LCEDHGGGRSSEEEEEVDKCEPEPLPSFTEVHSAYETVKSVFHMHSTGKHDGQFELGIGAVLSEM
jgi:hypothetical protein